MSAVVVKNLRRGIAAAAIAAALAVPAMAKETPPDIQGALNAAYAKYKDLQEGANADYIPALAKVDSVSYTHLTLPTILRV